MYWCLNLVSEILIAEPSFLVFLNDGLCQKQDWCCFIFGNIYKSWLRSRTFVGRGNALPLYRWQPAGIVECRKVDLNSNLQVVRTIWLFPDCAKKKKYCIHEGFIELAAVQPRLFYFIYYSYILSYTHPMDLESMNSPSIPILWEEEVSVKLYLIGVRASSLANTYCICMVCETYW